MNPTSILSCKAARLSRIVLGEWHPDDPTHSRRLFNRFRRDHLHLTPQLQRDDGVVSFKRVSSGAIHCLHTVEDPLLSAHELSFLADQQRNTYSPDLPVGNDGCLEQVDVSVLSLSSQQTRFLHRIGWTSSFQRHPRDLLQCHPNSDSNTPAFIRNSKIKQHLHLHKPQRK